MCLYLAGICNRGYGRYRDTEGGQATALSSIMEVWKVPGSLLTHSEGSRCYVQPLHIICDRIPTDVKLRQTSLVWTYVGHKYYSKINLCVFNRDPKTQF